MTLSTNEPVMPYFGIDPERYGGYNREEELKYAELPSDRELSGEADKE